MRINDLAKELGKQNKDLITFLIEKGIGNKTPMSSVSDDEMGIIRKKFGTVKNSGAAEKKTSFFEKKAEPPKAEAKPAQGTDTAKEPEKKEEAPKKKKFTAVFRPQNAQQIHVRPISQRPLPGKTAVVKPVAAAAVHANAAPAAAAAPQEKVLRPAAPAQHTEAVKPEAVKSETVKPEAVKPETVKSEAVKPAETKAPETKPAEAKAPESKPAEVKVPETRAAETKAPEKKTEELPKKTPETASEKPQAKQPEKPVSVPAPAVQAAAPASSGETHAEEKKAAERPQQNNQQNPPKASGTQHTGTAFIRTGDTHPTNSGYQGNRNNGTGYQGNRSGSGYQGNRSGGSGYQGNRPAGSGYQGNRPAGSGYQGNRPAGSGYQGNRPAGSGYQGNRPAGSGYQGNRPAGSGYQGNRPAGSGYQGNRPAGSGYQGNRPAGSGYQGNRPAGGGYQGNRTGTGYQGRPGTGFAGRPGGGFGQRPGNFAGKDNKPADGPLVKKTQRNRPNENAFKNRNDKRHRTEDGVIMRTGKISRHPFIMPEKPKNEKVEEDIKEIIIPETITIKDLAKRMKLNASDIISKLFKKGEMYTINSEIAYEKAEEIALDYDVICAKEKKVDVIAELLKEGDEDTAKMVMRPPVVCVMGHVDHGKTSLLDAIRKTNVTSHEAGGITQHIGAYMVKINNRQITFLDTPGHEAFTAMRMRGAQATDIAVLVVAADDGVMPQTIEAINHAKAAGVEIIVAINKIDKPNANVDRVKQELSEYELIPEDWGGSTIFCEVSAKTQAGIPNLLEMILLAADVKELKANPDRKARGLVIEAMLDKGRGPVATILVQKGTLHVGDFVACGACYGKVRAMLNEKGKALKEASPSTPVQILGLDNVPNAGEIFMAMDSDKEAKDFAATFISEGKTKLIDDTKAKLSLDDLFDQIKAGNVKELPIIVKADVQGSVEAVNQSLGKLSNAEVQVKVIHSGVGAINESDVALASASNAIIIGFNVRPDATAKSTAEHEKVDLRLYKVIYQAIDDVEAAMKGMLAPVYEEKITGHAEIRQLFKASGVGTIAGSYILDGKFQRGNKARITRGKDQIFDGPIASLKRFKDDVKKVNAGYECGLVFDGFNDIEEGDQVEAYTMVEVPRT